jgi:hypothetical protein
MSFSPRLCTAGGAGGSTGGASELRVPVPGGGTLSSGGRHSHLAKVSAASAGSANTPPKGHGS